ncbi:MAG TPA: hypothetical protein PLJ35_11740 [Anaerolineae bacterium]|nr:hypothetical protein [Anaerolineae bacterium]HPL27788.1 hypothetical protein [Anaerolineae bacterium]HPL27791.1 hypothetical protein [Anaerolineae bacterium]
MSKTVKLSEFCGYIAGRQREIVAVYAEIEQVQQQFNELFRQKMQAWQTAISRGVPLLLGDQALPPALAQSLLQVIGEERAKLEREIADLTAQVDTQRQAADRTVAEAQAEMQTLRRANPQLDAEEEAIKARRAEIAQALQQLDAEIKATGWLTGFFRRRRLRRQRDQVRAGLATETARLRRVRQQWQDEKQRFEANQGRLCAQWEAAGIEAAQAQARLDHLLGNLERLSREQGAARLLAELTAAPAAAEPLHTLLAEMAELNRTKAEYEEGLRTVAEALGLLKGLGEGMERFYRSAAKVLEEQRQYNLRELRIELSAAVLDFHALWPELRAQVKDEKTLGAQPAEFSRRVRAAIEGRLGDSAIAAMFESMGDALTRATKAWG